MIRIEKEKRAYDIYFDKSMDAVIMEWNGDATSGQFREGSELMLDNLIQNNAYKMLANLREMVLISKEDQQWLDTHFFPKALKFGFKALAIIRPTSFFNKVAIESISYKANDKNLSIQIVDTIEEAEDWLRKIK